MEFSEDIRDELLSRIADGESLRAICEDERMPGKTTVFRWLASDEAFRDQYAHAREAQADSLFDDILDIADDSRNDWMKRNHGEDDEAWVVNGEHVQRTRLRIEARKWMAGKLRPKKYGERMELTGNPDAPLQMITRIEIVAGGNG